MAGSSRPTRTESCALGEAIVSGFDGFVLSDETAIGSYPEASVALIQEFDRDIRMLVKDHPELIE